MTIDLDAIRARLAARRAIAEAATPGPWSRDQAQDGEVLPDGTGYAGDYYETNDVIAVPKPGDEFTTEIASCGKWANAAFIAAARTDVPDGCADLEAALAEVERLRASMAEAAAAFDRHLAALTSAQRGKHNYEEWNSDEWDPIDRACGEVVKALDARADK